VSLEVRQDIISGNTYNFTIRISQPQLEIGVSSPTAYKPTTGTAFYGPRFDHDPVTLQSRGLLIEEARTNLNLNSATGSLQTITVVSGSSYTLSFYGTGSMVMAGAYTGTLTGAGAFPTRTTLTFTASTTSLVISSVTGTVQYVQVELGLYASSYIPTGTSQATRSVDIATANITDYSRTVPNAQGAYSCKYQLMTLAANNLTVSRKQLLSIYDTTNSRLSIRSWSSSTNTEPSFAIGNGTSAITFASSSPQGVGPHSICATWDSTWSYAAIDGGIIPPQGSLVVGVGNTPPTQTTLDIGGATVNQSLAGWISSLAYYPTRLNEAKALSLTR
jgi:hypothetical protein